MSRLQLPPESYERFRTHLAEQGFSFENRLNQVFLARGSGAVVNLYTNGTILISGGNVVLAKGLYDFAISIGAQEVTKSGELEPLDFPFPHVGTDEVGKGDYFGPLVIAGALVPPDKIDSLTLLGVRDSKCLSDTSVRHLASQIRRQLCPRRIKVVPITPRTYNKLYGQMRNVNVILGWGHARAIEDLLINGEPFELAVADQFGDPGYIAEKLMARGRQIELKQVHKAERDLAVATASIMARDEFLRMREEMSLRFQVTFPKGASDVISFGKKFVEDHGIDALVDVAKLHFSITKQITGGMMPSVKEELTKAPEHPVAEPIAPGLIRKGEGANIEFKTSLRWNEKTQKTDREIELAVLRTLAAFLNTDGGVLLIGVADDKSVRGVEKDGFPNNDKYLLHLWNLVNNSLGRDLGPYIHTDFERVEGKQVLIVTCRKSPKPVYLKQQGKGDEEFYVRTGPGNTKLHMSDAQDYISTHFGSLKTFMLGDEGNQT